MKEFKEKSYYIDPRLIGKSKYYETSIDEIMSSTGESRDVILNRLYLVQPPIIRSTESFRSSRAEIKKAKKNQYKTDEVLKAFANWSNYKPRWGGFKFNGVAI